MKGSPSPLIIGVLSLQGDFDRHRGLLEQIPVLARSIRYPHELDGLDGLIIPGGESTTIGKLMDRLALIDPLRRKISEGLPVFGTCAGAILLAKTVPGQSTPLLGLMDMQVARNAYGRQVDSFEADIFFPVLGAPPVRSVFIRAPVIEKTADTIDILGHFEDRPVLVRQSNMLAATFHPELTDDPRIHSFFIRSLVLERQKIPSPNLR